jgi:Zinc-ribbon containing domain
VNANTSKLLQLTLSGLGNWLILIAIAILLGAVGLGWIVKSIFIFLGLLLIAPFIAAFILRWWLSRNLIQDSCPVCSYEFAGLAQSQLQCPNCGEPLQIENGHFTRLAPPGTIDIDAIEVSVKQISD